MIWMEKIIGEHGSNPLPVIPFPELRDIDYNVYSD